MVRLVESGPTATIRSGIPDYQQWVWSSNVVHRIKLQSTEAVLRLAVLCRDVVPPSYPVFPGFGRASLAPGETQRVYNTSTGTLGYTLPQGYTLAVLSYWASWSGPVRMGQAYDGFSVSEWLDDGGKAHYEHDILEDYNPLDPTGLTSHQVEHWVTNLAGYNVEGYLMITTKLIEVGTPPYPPLKKVRCAGCGHLWEIPKESTLGICPKCEFKNLYYPILFGNEIKRILEERRREE